MIDPDGKSGVAVMDKENKTITIRTKLVFYGDEATSERSHVISHEIAGQFNGVNATLEIDGVKYKVNF